MTPFAAEGQQLVDHAQRQNVFAVHRVTLRCDRSGLARIFIIHFLAVEFQLAIADIPAAVVAQGVVLALKAVAVKRVGIPILAIEPVASGDVLILGGRPGEFDVAVAAGEAFNTRRFARCVAGSLLIVLGALRQAAVGFHPQHAVNQRAAGKELTVVRIAAIAVFLNGGIRAEGARPLLTDFFGDDINHAAEGVGTIEGRHRPAHHFDTLNGINRDPVEVKIVVAENGVARVNAFAVNEDQRIAAAEAANAHPFAVIPFVGELHARHFPQYILQVLYRSTLQILLGDNANTGGRIFDALFSCRSGDDQRFFVNVGERRKRQGYDGRA